MFKYARDCKESGDKGDRLGCIERSYCEDNSGGRENREEEEGKNVEELMDGVSADELFIRRRRMINFMTVKVIDKDVVEDKTMSFK